MGKAIGLLTAFIMLVSGLSRQVSAQIVTEKSEVNFSIGHMGGTVDGTITGMKGTVQFDENNLAGSIMQATVEAATVDTGNRARDSDLRKDKFFDTNRYPEIRFISKSFSKTAGGYEVTGNLTIKDKTREVTIPFQREITGNEVMYSGRFALNRKDFDLGKSAFPPIGKTVKVKIKAIVR